MPLQTKHHTIANDTDDTYVVDPSPSHPGSGSIIDSIVCSGMRQMFIQQPGGNTPLCVTEHIFTCKECTDALFNHGH